MSCACNWLGVAVYSQAQELTAAFEQERKALQDEAAAAAARADKAEAREKATSQQLECQEAEVQRLQGIVTDINALQEAKQVCLHSVA